MRFDCVRRNPTLRLGFPAGWLQTVFQLNCLKIGLGVLSCRVDAADLGRCQKNLVKQFRAALVGKLFWFLMSI